MLVAHYGLGNFESKSDINYWARIKLGLKWGWASVMERNKVNDLNIWEYWKQD